MHPKAPIAPWVFEGLGPLLWIVMAVYYVRQCRKTNTLTVPALVFIGATTMWWQEWYGDWSSYLLYTPKLHLIPGYHLPLTSGNKPWAVIPAYGWFFGLVYFPIIAGVRRVHDRLAGNHAGKSSPDWNSPDRRPDESPMRSGPAGGTATAVAYRTQSPATTVRRYLPSFTMTLLLVGFVLHYLWDLLIEGVATQWGLWNYTHTVGPAIVGSRGAFPLLYPVIPFAIMMSLTMLVIDSKRADGTPTVEAWARVDRFTGASRTTARVTTWVLTMNLTYLLLFIGPIVIIRAAFLPRSNIVP